VADHSGLAEVAAGLRAAYPAGLGELAAFPLGDAAALHDRLARVLALDADTSAALRAAARRAAVQRWSWTGVAERVLALAGDALVSGR
jgi:hypothetical protein